MRALLTALLLASGPLHAGTQILASGELPASTRDPRGDTLGGIGSALVFQPSEDLFYSLTDRGPGDGSLPYSPRIAVLKIPRSRENLQPEVLKTILLKDQEGHAMTGLIPDDPKAPFPKMSDGRLCIDPEGLAVAADGTFYVSDEYGPYIYQFTPEGGMIRRIGLPESYEPRTPEGVDDFTDKARLASGRNINQGPEGLCLLPDGKSAAVILQSGLVQDGGHSAPFARLLILDLKTGRPAAEYAFSFEKTLPGSEGPLAVEDLSVNDLACLSPTRFLVLERDKFGRDGSNNPRPAAFKAVWLVDTTGASNLLETEASKATPVKKSLLFNLPDLVPAPEKLAAKWESLAVMPSRTDDSLTLMMAADNDFLAPVIFHDGASYPFPRTEDSVPTQFFLIETKTPPSGKTGEGR